MSTNIQLAIQLALQCRWDEAIELNLQLLASNPTDIATLNRLAKCYLQLGDKDLAKKTYQQVLTHDKYNAVALKSLKTLSLTPSIDPSCLCQEDFIETPGLTKTSSLIKVADRKTLSSLSCKQVLAFKPKTHLVSVVTENSKTYVGSLPDDLSLKIIKNLKLGYIYQVCLKSATENMASIFIRELKRPNKKGILPSFQRRLHQFASHLTN